MAGTTATPVSPSLIRTIGPFISPSVGKSSVNDETVWSGAYETEWKASDQCELGVRVRFKNPGILRLHDFRRIDHVVVSSARCRELNTVAHLDPFQLPK